MDLEAQLRGFQVAGAFRGAVTAGGGHINDTWFVDLDESGTPMRVVLQRLNPLVFPDPAAVMANMDRVTRHLNAKLAAEGAPDAGRRALRLLPTKAGGTFLTDADGAAWRCVAFIPRARTFETVQGAQHAFEAARAIGGFLSRLADLGEPPLQEVIPGFHDTPARLGALRAAAAADRAERAKDAADALAFAEAHAALAEAIPVHQLPVRPVHNDTKLANVMMDEATGEGLCVIDLDTVMPGCALHDFGDLVRSAVSPTAEDAAEVRVDLVLFEALARGFLQGCRGLLTPGERAHLAQAPAVITYELGLRFLADHLAGDPYFRITRPHQNLDRARAQFALVAAMEKEADEIEKILERS
ncbi:MAG TPA: phosphotransferase [Geothrix sp.]|nr:phosphotransferase [Geothrix sp.]